MQKLAAIILFFSLAHRALAVESSSVIQSSGNLEERMYFVQEMSAALFEVCFHPDGTYKGEVIFSQPELSIRETAIDCQAQIDALNQEIEEIDALMDESPGLGCNVVNVSSESDSLTAGVDEILGAQNSCPGRGNADQERSALIQNIACSLGRIAIPAINLTGLCRNGDCATNLFAGAAYSASDMLSLFGLCFMCPQESAGRDAAAEERGASDDAAIAASFQEPESVTSFNTDPIGWVSSAATSLFNSMKTSIMERFGCAQWEDPNRPYRSKCLAPVSWSCASPSQKTNMVCGTAGYVLGVVGMEVATAGAAGAAIGAAGLVARATMGVARSAATMFPRTAAGLSIVGRSFGRAMRLGTTAAIRLRSAWTAVKQTRSMKAISMVSAEIAKRVQGGASRVAAWREAFRGQYFTYSAAEDLLTAPARAAIAAARRFNQLSEQAFNLGYSATGAARLRAIGLLEARSPLIADIKSGKFVDTDGNPLDTPEKYFNWKYGDSPDLPHLRPIVGDDGRLRVVDTRSAAFRGEIRLNGLDGPAPTTAPRAAPAPAPAAANVVEEESVITVTANAGDMRRLAARRRDQLTDVAGRQLSDEAADTILDLRSSPEGETLLQFNQRREQIITELRRGGAVTDAAALRQYNELVRDGLITERQVLAGTSNIPSPGVADSFDNARDLDLVIGRYATNGETPASVISTIQRGDSAAGIGSLDDFFRARNVPPADQRTIRSLWDDTLAQRSMSLNRQVADDITRLRGNGAEVTSVNCNGLNRLQRYSDAFAGQCHRIKLTQASRGEYCTCNTRWDGTGDMRKPGPWMLPCAQVGEYLTSRSQADFTALPAKDINRCWKVDLPENTVCYHGGLGATFSGFGGQAQMACLDERSLRAIRSENPSALDPNSPDFIPGLELPPATGASNWQISNWSPISNNPEVLRITQIGRECFDQTTTAVSCSADTLDEIRRLIDNGNLSELDRNELELYYQYLRGDLRLDPSTGYPFCMRGGAQVIATTPRDCLPAGQTLRSSTRTEQPSVSRRAGESTEAFIERNKAEFERVSGLNPAARADEASRALGRDLSATQRSCVLDAHDIGISQGRGYGTFTFEDIRAKRNTLTRCGFSASDARELMDRGIAGGFPPTMRLGQPAGMFGKAQGEAALQRAESLTARFRGPRAGGGGQGVTRLEYQRSLEEAGAAFENQARQSAGSIMNRQNIENSLSAYLRAGDSTSVMRMVAFAKESGLPEEDILRLLGRISAQDGTSPMGPSAMIALRSVRTQLEEARAARAAAEAATRAPAEVPPTVTVADPAVRQQQERITRLMSDAPLSDPRLLIDRANQYRLGDHNRAIANLPPDVQTFIRGLTPTQRADVSSNLYYQASREHLLNPRQSMDGMLEVGGTNPRARELSNAIEQSFRGEGVVARRMIDDIVRARGATGLREFIQEAESANFAGLFLDVPANQGAKSNLRGWASYIQSTYADRLTPEDIRILQTFR